jgi:hypothetical protein
MRPNKREAPIFYSRHDLWIFTKWICDMSHFFDWSNLLENKRVRYIKMKLIDTT